MTPERWRRLTGAFHAAVALPVAERARFLDEACAGDADLRAEVEAMLAADVGGRSGRGPVSLSASLEALELEPGDTVGPYGIAALIGSGGMGRVYRARDARLDRDVALKVLPAEYAADADRLRRFEQEARASGALTHPNLITVHDVGVDDGRPYLVTELVDGETLRERLQRGAVPIVRACVIGVAMARGLAAAHAKGIVHRDLKPENVMVTRDGRVKILDFGVAKLRAPDGPMQRPVREGVQTEAGVLVGTPGYMAPEQVRGLDADARADLFALGAILFELLTGRSAFERPTRAETLEAILRDDPVSTAASAAWPPAVRRVVQRCLEKEPEARFQSAADLAFALEGIDDVAASAPSGGARRRGVTRGALGVVGAFGIVLALLALRLVPDASHRGDALARFALPIGERVRSTGPPAISPDGSSIVFAASEGLVDSQRLHVRHIDQVSTVALPGTERAISAFFSPDGTSVVYWADDALYRTRLDGATPPVLLCRVEGFLGASWTSRESIVFASRSGGLQRVDANGGAPQPMGIQASPGEIDLRSPAMLPGGRQMLVTVHEGPRRFRIDVVSLDTGHRRAVVDEGFDARYVSTGHLVFAAGTSLFAAPFDLTRLERSGPPVKLVDGLATDPRQGHAPYALSDTGALVFLPLPPPARRTLTWVDRAGTGTPLPLEPREYWTPRVSPDGRQVATVVVDQQVAHIWLYRLDNGTLRRLTSDGRNWAPVWSPDGASLVYASERDGRWHLIREPVDGRGAAQVLISGADELEPGTFSQGGRTMVFVRRSATGEAEWCTLDLERRETTILEGMPLRGAMPAVSPDGRWLGFTSGTGVRPSIFVRPYPTAGPVRQLVDGAGYTVWSRSGDAVFFRSRRGAVAGSAEDGIFEVPFDRRRGVATGPPKQLFRTAFADWWGVPGFDVAPDGRFLLAIVDRAEALPIAPNVMLHVDDELRRRTRPGDR